MIQTNSAIWVLRMMLAIALLLFSAFSAPAVELDRITAALDQVPIDAVSVAIVPNCTDLSHHLSQVNDAMDLRMVELADVLGEWKHRSGILEGFDDNGSVLVVIDDPLAASAGGSGLALLPVDDYEKFVANFGQTADESVMQLRMLDEREPFVKAVPGYAVVGSDQKVVASYESPRAATTWQTRLGAMGLGCLADCDVALLINVEKLRPILQPVLEHTLGLDRRSQTTDVAANASQAIRAVIGQGLSAFLRDTHTLVLALDADASGVGVTMAAQFNAGSRLGKLFNGRGTSAPKLLDRLPNEQYLIAMGINTAGLSVPQLMQDTINQIPIDQFGSAGEMFHEQQKLLKQLRGLALNLVANDWQGEDEANQQALSFAALMNASDSRAFIKSFRSYLDQLNGKTVSFLPAVQSTAFAIYMPNEQVVGKVSVDRYQVTYQYADGVELPTVLKAVGLAGTAGYVARIDPHHVVQTNTTDATLLNKLVMSAQALAPSEDQTQEHLGQAGEIPQLRRVGLATSNVLEMYLNLRGIAIFIAPMIEAFTGNRPIAELPPAMSTVAIWANAEGEGLAGRGYVPMAVLWWLRDTLSSGQPSLAPGGLRRPVRRRF